MINFNIMKICKACKRDLPDYNYYKHKLTKDGLRSHCKECEKMKNKINAKRWNKSKYKEYGMSIATIKRNGFKTALEVYDKYNRQCAYCKIEDDLTIHHLDGRGRNYYDNKKQPNNNIENLILLCRSCHGRIHGYKSGGKFKKGGGRINER